MARKRGHRKAKPKLSLAQRRARAQDRNPLYDPTQQLSGHLLARGAKTLAGMEINPSIHELDRQSGQVGAQGAALSGRAADYYRQLAAQESGNIAKQQELQGRTRAALADIAKGTEGQIDKAQGEEQQRLQSDAALRGQGLSGGVSATSELANARARAAEGAQTYRSSAELTGANYGNLTAGMANARGMRGGEIQGQLATRTANQLQELGGKRADLVSQRGALTTKNLLSLRQSGFENLATAKGLNIRLADLKESTRQHHATEKLASARAREVARANRARERIAEINAEVAKGNLSERKRHDLEGERQSLYKILHPSSKGGKGGAGGGLSDSKRLGYRDTWEGYVGDLRAGKKPPQGTKPILVGAAQEYERNRKIHGYGWVGEKTRRAVRKRYGFSIPAYRRQGDKPVG